MVRVLTVFLVFAALLCGQQYVIFTFAGGVPPVTPAPAAASSVGDPPRAAVDSAGNVYFGSDHAIFKVDLTGTLTCIAGTGREGFSGDGGPATSAQMSYPWGVAVDAAGNVYFTDKNSNNIRRIAVNGTINTFAGSAAAGFAGDGGPATAALFSGPSGLAADSAGNLYVADTGNQRIRKIAPDGTVSTVAGTGNQGYGNDGAPALSADLNSPEGVAVDPSGNLYIADTENQRVREVAKDGIISTIAGSGFPGYSGDNGPAVQATLFLPTDVAADSSGNVYIADLGSSRIRMVSNGNITTIAGSDAGILPTVGQAAVSIRFNGPTGVAVDGAGNVYFAEGSIGSGSGLGTGDYRVWEITQGIADSAAGDGLESYGGDGGPAATAQVNNPAGMAFDSAGNLYIADSGNNRVRRISPSGTIVTVAGTGVAGYSGDNGPATSAQLNGPSGVAVDTAGNLYIADTGNNRVRVVLANGTMVTLAGNGNAAFAGDGGPATQASLHAPLGVAVDRSGNVFIADTLSLRVREVVVGSSIIQTLAGNGVAGYSGDGGPATNAALNSPSSVALDSAGNLYFTDELNGLVRKISPIGVITTVAGTPPPIGPGLTAVITGGDGGPATQALLLAPKGVLVDGSGNLYITDSGENRVRMVSSNGIISTLAGDGTCCYSGDGGLGTVAQLNVPWGLAMDTAGNLYVTDSGNDAIRQLMPAGSTAFLLRVANAASDQGGGIAPGEIVAVYGAGLGPAQGIAYQPQNTGQIVTQLGGTQVLFNGTPAPILFTSAGQVSAIVPYEVSGSNVQVTVSYNGQTTAALSVPLVAAAPAVFSLDASGSGAARALNSDDTQNSPTNPAPVGSIVTFYATGAGQTSPPGEDGAINPAVAPQPVLPVSVTIGGIPASVQYAAGAPGQVQGLMMVQVVVPSGVAPGSAVPVELQVGTAASPATVTIAVTQ
ncbi:MAG TPA: IPT/TIG domain-containing protein [Bryobacteraceae bacterium]|nr:IPT/TIG domain-containing protein [Bryobacteraceae bacterium]